MVMCDTNVNTIEVVIMVSKGETKQWLLPDCLHIMITCTWAV